MTRPDLTPGRPSAGQSTSEAGGPAPIQSIVKVDSVSKRYGEREALRGVSFEAGAGEMVAVIGPNGAGKTTLLSILAGVQPPTTGGVRLPPGKVGWVPQQPALYSRLSVAENLELFARLERNLEPSATVAAMLEQTGLQERAGERVERLSGGNRQRVNIAIGLLSEPTVLVLDEPSSSLDPRQRERLWRFICGLSQRGRCVVFSTHNVAEAERYAQRVVVLADGELLFNGSPDELAREQRSTQQLIAGDPGPLSSTYPDFEGAFVEFLRARGH